MTDPNGRTSIPLARTSAGAGRLPVLALLGLAAGSLPLPIVPPRILAGVRGAVAHDVASRHGLSLTDAARSELARASAAVRGGAILTTFLFFLRRSYRRLGAIGVLPPLSASFEVYALGILLDRYFSHARASSTVRVDEAEAQSIRKTIDQAIKRSLSVEFIPREHEPVPGAAEDLRPLTTRLSDGVLLALAELPLFFQRRLEAAFDVELANETSKRRDAVGA